MPPNFCTTRATNREYWARFRARVPLQRPGSPDDTAAACAFLCSDGGAYITVPMVITRDPKRGIRNVGMYRIMQTGKTTPWRFAIRL